MCWGRGVSSVGGMTSSRTAASAPVTPAAAGDRSRYATLARITGAAGLVTLLAVVGTSIANGYQNQSMTEGTPAIVAFFRSIDDRTGWLTSYATSAGLVACLWFAIGLALMLRPYERGVPWRAPFLAAAGVVSVVSGQIASWDAAAFRSATIDPRVATYAYDLGNLSFANSWVSTGAVGICAGLIMLRAPGVPRWIAYWGLVAGIGEVLARAWFRHGFAYAPFALYWAWVLALSVLLLAGRFTSSAAPKEILP
jgi:hypothetical protein